ncbi:hypothetical protein [Photobacterium leiognathi]|uniref:hypothetical protein n=1 Tax=Photobacterium leiognathi TaxID=553611 RepID=UPI002739358F|nr:hypothetical protein [Photobacterium leiognathi]
MVLLLCIGLLADKHDKRGGGLSWAVNGFGIAFVGTIGNVIYIGLHPICINAVRSTAALGVMFLLLALFTVLYFAPPAFKAQKAMYQLKALLVRCSTVILPITKGGV